MSTVAKVFVVLNLILAVAFLGAASAFLGWDDWHKKRAEAMKGDYEVQIKKLNDKIGETNALLGDATRARDEATKLRDQFQGENQALKVAYDQMKKSYDELNATATAATRALLVAQNTIKEGRALTDQLLGERQKLTDEAKRFQEERDGAISRAAAGERDLEKAMVELKDAQAKLSSAELNLQRTEFRLQAILAAHPNIGGALEQPMQTAKVLAADDATNVVVLSLGSEDGVKEGFKYTISRGNAYVATVEVTHVEGKQAAGRSLRDVQKSPVLRGDDAMTAR